MLVDQDFVGFTTKTVLVGGAIAGQAVGVANNTFSAAELGRSHTIQTLVGLRTGTGVA